MHAFRVGLAASLAVALAGCASGSTPAPTTETTPTVSPTYLCTPASGTPSPCAPEEYTRQLEQTQLNEKAADIYHQMANEVGALSRKGGALAPTDELATTAGGPYLAGQLAILGEFAQRGLVLDGPVTVTTAPAEGAAARGYEVAVFACVDSRGAQLRQGEAVVSPGRLIAETAYFKTESGQLKVWDAETADPARC